MIEIYRKIFYNNICTNLKGAAFFGILYLDNRISLSV